MSDLVPAAAPAVEAVDEMRAFYRVAEQLAAKIHGERDFVGAKYVGRPAAILCAMIWGHEIGFAPMKSLRYIDVIDGHASLSSEGQRALVLARGHAIDVIEHTTERCTVQGTRADNGVNLRVTWDLDDARRAGLAGKTNWQKYPRAMLLARATSELCGAIFPDVTGGFASAVVDVTGVDPTDDVEVEPMPDVDPTRCALDSGDDETSHFDGPGDDDEPASDTDEVSGDASTVEDAVLVDEETGEVVIERLALDDVEAVEYDDDDPERPF